MELRIRPRIVLAAMLLAAAASPVHAQLKAGVTFSSLSGTTGEFGTRQGFMGGIGLSFLRFGPVSLTPELLYVQKGGKLDTPTESGIEDIRLDYFVVPAMLEFGNYIRGTAIRPGIYGGMYYAFQTQCSIGFNTGEGRSNGCPISALQEMGIDADIEDSDWGWVLGGSLSYTTVSIGSISIDVRYTAGLADIARFNSNDEPKNRSFEITAGWRPDFR